jgi:hypothetical protein
MKPFFTEVDFFTAGPYNDKPVKQLLLPCVARDIANAKTAIILEIIDGQDRDIKHFESENKSLKYALSYVGDIPPLTEEVLSLREALADAEEALALIALPKRADGSYNRGREAVRQLAQAYFDKHAHEEK